MRQLFIVGVTVFLCLSTNLLYASGVAVCIAHERNSANNPTDVRFFLRHGSGPQVDGYDAS